jgi:hypothetical protein
MLFTLNNIKFWDNCEGELVFIGRLKKVCSKLFLKKLLVFPVKKL